MADQALSLSSTLSSSLTSSQEMDQTPEMLDLLRQRDRESAEKGMWRRKAEELALKLEKTQREMRDVLNRKFAGERDAKALIEKKESELVEQERKT